MNEGLLHSSLDHTNWEDQRKKSKERREDEAFQ